MCGRFSLAMEAYIISQRFEVPFGSLEWLPRYNIAPTQDCLVICNDHNKRIEKMRWGLIPHGSKDKKSGYPIINARAETLSAKPTFRNLIQTRRCIIPADGFFEWKQSGKGKVPFRAALKNGEVFSFAGLWDSWLDEDQKELKSFAIVTTNANSLLRPIHDRMPVMLKQEDEARWLDPGIKEIGKLDFIFQPYPANDMEIYEVSPLVNTWKNDVPEAVKKLTI